MPYNPKNLSSSLNINNDEMLLLKRRENGLRTFEGTIESGTT